MVRVTVKICVVTVSTLAHLPISLVQMGMGRGIVKTCIGTARFVRVVIVIVIVIVIIVGTARFVRVIIMIVIVIVIVILIVIVIVGIRIGVA